ncbi:MAG TPA: hypothetical protein VJ978_14825 [Nitriliruptoraceae bacterium]|nr:hypothetical protein [Nitriliruptoraceae bacterium]
MTTQDPRHDEPSGAGDPLDTGDRRVLADLARIHGHLDPVPADLAARARFAVAMAEVEAEVARLVSTDHGAGARAGVRSSGAATARTITFSTDDHTLTLMIGGSGHGRRRLDGWIAGGAGSAALVGLRMVGSTVDVEVSDEGRFGVDDMPEGMAQVSVHDADGGALLVTPTFLV